MASERETARALLESVTVGPDDVLVIHRRGWTEGLPGERDEFAAALATEIQRRRMGNLVLMLGDGQSLASLDEAGMRRHGWARVPLPRVWREGARIRDAGGLGYDDVTRDETVRQLVDRARREAAEMSALAALGEAVLALREQEREAKRDG